MVQVRSFDRAMNLDGLLSALGEQTKFAGIDAVRELSRRRNAVDGKFVSGGTEYELGNPHPEYEKAFPNAKTRILAALH